MIPLSKDTSPPPANFQPTIAMAANVVATSSAAKYACYVHQLLCSLPAATLLLALDKSTKLQTNLGLTLPLICSHLPKSTATNKGHMQCHCSNTASTRNKHADVILARAEVDHMFPAHKACAVQDMFCFAPLADPTTGTMYTDLTGAFPVRSFKNMQYIFVVYIYDSTQSSSAQCLPKLMHPSSPPSQILRTWDYQPALNVIDNECSKAVKRHIQSNKMEIQLISLHNHCVNVAERAISTFKEHFVAALATLDMLCPLQLWDKFLPQVELTLNLLRFSHCNPLISANHKLYGPFDFNKMPLALLDTKALVYDGPATQTSWAPHATDGFYIGPAIDHYQCLHFYIISTQCFRFSDTWWLCPTHCRIPVLSKHNKTLQVAGDIFKQLGGTIPTTASAKMKHLSAIRQLTANMSARLDAPSPVPTAPRVETATPLRVAVAAPPRVATTLNTITALSTIHLLPIVHQ
jgi:hypothetical protein